MCGRDARAPSKPSSHDSVTPRAQYCRSIWVPLVVEAGRSVFWSIRVDSCPFVVRFHEQSAVFAGMIQLSCGAVGRDSGTFMRRERGLGASQGKASLCGRGRRSNWSAGKLALAIKATCVATGCDQCRRSGSSEHGRSEETSRTVSSSGRRQVKVRNPNPSRVHGCMPFGYDPNQPCVLARNAEMQPDQQSKTAGPADGFG